MGTDPNSPTPQNSGTRTSVPVPPPSFGGNSEGPTEVLVAGTVGDRCVNCGAPLSTDQRYCVNCGERRGAARFTLPAASAASAEPASPPPSQRPRRRPRPTQGATLIAGIGTLLLAMGVGVLIGHSSGSTKTVQAAHAQVITVNAGGGGGAATTAAPTTTASKTSTSGSGGKHSSKKSSGGSKGKSSKSHKSKPKAPAAPKATQQEAQAAQSAANKVTGGSDVNDAPVTVTSGQSCSGQGCQGGKFTGNFFGGG
jgi:hypothetical protein